ncbi:MULTISPECIES: pyridoxal-phosphate dependent enzyme [Streptomyces]|uniref:pyridoxal-phosphate dependent enzyme n=1 Tax=Streptomyces TaxID=1883 RepID=UPI002D218B01|nr:pyridoxal-phosphate dependent enzyme [Streptomyces sp. NRRL F-3307]
MKLEMHNPTGSVKYRTAVGLLADMHTRRPLVPGTEVIESTSGNLGLALARLLGEIGCTFTAVVDPKLPDQSRALLLAEGARLVTVRERDRSGGYLLTRLRKVAELREADPELRWPDQYRNPANPGVHQDVTAPELLEQTSGGMDTVLAAVSTGGTLAGLGTGLRRALPAVRTLPVDVVGSAALSDRVAVHSHLLTGIGAGRRTSFLHEGSDGHALRVRDVQAFAHCRMFAQDTGLSLGGSTGALLAAYVHALGAGRGALGRAVGLSPDGGENYRSTFYDDDWLRHHGVYSDVVAATVNARGRGLRYELEGITP